MRSLKILLLIVFMILCQVTIGQQTTNPWEKWNFLLGEWVGEGGGQPGQNGGTFSFQTDLDKKILVRKNHTVFPATVSSPEKIHDDLLIVYPASHNGPQEAIYFDNEGNTIKYKVSFHENSLVLTSDIIPNTARFRLSYVTVDNKTVNITFEMASPQTPEEFRVYLSGKATKVK
jgi:hypothetical protein